MKTTDKTSILLSASAALLFFSNTANAQTSVKSNGLSSVNITVQAQGLSNVSIETSGIADKVDVQGWDRKHVEIECSGGRPVIETKAGSVLINNELEEGCEKISVRMPKTLKLKIVAVSENVSVTTLDNRVGIVSVSGDVRAYGLNGATAIEVVSGDLDVRSARGDLSCKGVSGDLRIVDSAVKLLEAKTVSGDINIGATQAEDIRLASHSGDIKYTVVSMPKNGLAAKTFSGDVQITLPESTGFDISAETYSGSINVEHKIQARVMSANRVVGIFKDGGPDLSLATFSGDIRLRISQTAK